MVKPISETHHGKGVFRAHGVGRDLGHKLDVLAGRQARDEIVELKHEADMGATVGGPLRLARSGQLVIPPSRMSRSRRIQSAEDVQQCGFSRPGRPEHDDELACPDLQIKAPQSVHRRVSAAVSLAELASDEDHLGLGRRRPTAS